LTSARATVAIPTHGRPAALARCLAAIRRQTIAPSLDVVVVDDASEDRQAVERAVAGTGATLVRHPMRRGPAAARNSAVRAASAPIVLFTDDDCEPSEDWAERLLERLQEGAEAAAGRTLNALTTSALATASQLIADSLRRELPGSGDALAFAASSNLGVTVPVLKRVSFDESFPTSAGEDRDWCARLAAAGVALVDAPAAIVLHRHELDLPSFWRQHVAYGRGAHRFREAQPLGFEPPTWYLRLIRTGFASGARTGAAVVLAQLATVVGYIDARRRSAPRSLSSA
jgi:GT2 family glycosyltransferase